MYVDSFILAVPEDKKAEYRRVAEIFLDVAKDYGVVQAFENWEADVPDGDVTDYRKAVQAQPGEKVVQSWMIWPDKAAREAAHEKMYDDPRFSEMGEMPFDGKRMVIGSFEPLVTYPPGG